MYFSFLLSNAHVCGLKGNHLTNLSYLCKNNSVYRRISSSLAFSSQLMKPFNSLFNSFPGKGLGKEESGISKAIKVNVKTDLAGVSYIFSKLFPSLLPTFPFPFLAGKHRYVQINWSIFASYGTHAMNYFAFWGIFNYTKGTQDTEVTKSLHLLHLVTEVLIKPLCCLPKNWELPLSHLSNHGIHCLNHGIQQCLAVMFSHSSRVSHHNCRGMTQRAPFLQKKITMLLSNQFL